MADADDMEDVPTSTSQTPMEQAGKYLLCKAKVRLSDTSVEWTDRSNRLPDPKHIQALKQSFHTRGKLRTDPANRMVLWIDRASFSYVFRNENMGTLSWEGAWRPEEGPRSAFQDLKWPTTMPKFAIIAGQHRKLALEQHVKMRRLQETELYWVADIFAMDELPHNLLINLGGNVSNVEKQASSGEVYRDMAAIVENLPKTDKNIARSFLKGIRAGQESTLAETLLLNQLGQKNK